MINNSDLVFFTELLQFKVRYISRDRSEILKTVGEKINVRLIYHPVNYGKICTKNPMVYIGKIVKYVHVELVSDRL